MRAGRRSSINIAQSQGTYLSRSAVSNIECSQSCFAAYFDDNKVVDADASRDYPPDDNSNDKKSLLLSAVSLFVMRDSQDTVHFALIATVSGFSAAANLLLIVAVIVRTPRVMNSYSVLLLNTAGVDFCAALLCMTLGLRIQSLDGMVYFEYTGPCTQWNSQYCHRSLSLYAVLFVHSNVLLLFSYIYRWWMLGRSSLTVQGPPQIRGRMWIITLASIVPSLVTMAVSNSEAVFTGCPHSSVCSAYPLAPHGVMSQATAVTLILLFGTYAMTAVCFLLVRRLLIRRIQNLHSPERLRHQMVCNSLTAQAFLPLSGVAAAAAWVLDFFAIVQEPWLQRSIVLMSSAFALCSPLIILYFLKPYRRFVTDMLQWRPFSAIQPTDTI